MFSLIPGSERARLVIGLSCRYAFSLEENNQRDKAEEVGRKALSMEPRIPWATHAIGELMKEGGREREGERKGGGGRYEIPVI